MLPMAETAGSALGGPPHEEGQDRAHNPDHQAAQQRRNEPIHVEPEIQSRGEPGRDPQHRGVDHQQEEAECHHDEGTAQHGKDGPGDRVHQPEHEGDQQQLPDASGEMHSGDELHRDKERRGVDDEADQ